MIDRPASAAGAAFPPASGGAETNGRVQSGDVSLFYRRFGAPGKTPVIVMHGSNYFDSYDWIGVAGRLAQDREVVAFDHRGFGESGWSASKNYSLDARLADIRAVRTHLGWRKPAVMGHSASGRLAVSFAAHFPDELSRLIIVDSSFAHENSGPGGVGNPPLVFASVEAAMQRFARLANPPRIARDRERAEQALVKVAGGYRLKRDPDFQNARPLGAGAGTPVRPVREGDVWEELAKVSCPVLIVRGLRSDRFTPDIVARIEREFPRIQWASADSLHDIAYYAPDALLTAVAAFLAQD
jgi:pimeloyl-ACP methyl ester carboxylesterase